MVGPGKTCGYPYSGVQENIYSYIIIVQIIFSGPLGPLGSFIVISKIMLVLLKSILQVWPVLHIS